MGPSIPDDPDQPPGARNFVRILLETLLAHDDALASGEKLVNRLTPQHWSGVAREEFVEISLSRLDREWQQVADINVELTTRLDGHSTFVHNLPNLWSHYGTDPAELIRLRELYDQQAHRLADKLMAWAAELDALGHVDLSDSATSAAAPDSLPAPTVVDQPGPVSQPDWHDQAVTIFDRSYRMAARLREQMVAGERRDHIPWTG